MISLSERFREALLNPRRCPELVRCVVPGDRVILAVAPETPFAAEITSSVWEQLQLVTDGGAADIAIAVGSLRQWPRAQIPLHIQQQITVHGYAPAASSQISYVASTSGGVRVYLNRPLLDVNLTITVGTIAFDGLLGFRGISSILFSTFSDVPTQQSNNVQSGQNRTLTRSG